MFGNSEPLLAFFLGMYLLYLDESGDPGFGPKSSQYLVVGGAALLDTQWVYLEKEIQGLIDSYFPTGIKPKELHLNEIRSGTGSFRALTKLQRATLETDFCSLATSMQANEAVFFGVVADKVIWQATNAGKSSNDLFAEMVEQLTARFDLFLRRRAAEGNPQKGIIIADAGKGSIMQTVKDNHRKYQRTGTQWNQIYNVVETVFFLNSEESPGIQLADLCTYSIWRLLTAHDDVIARQISQCFDRESTGSRLNPGKWHGIKIIAGDAALTRKLQSVWAS